MRSDSESPPLLNNGVMERSCSDLTRRSVSDPAPDAPPATEPRCPLDRAPDDADITTAAAEAALNCARRHCSRRATTKSEARRNRAEMAPVMMATKGLIWLLEEGCGRGGSTTLHRKEKSMISFHSRTYELVNQLRTTRVIYAHQMTG